MLIPFGFTAELEDGSKVGYADKPVMIAEGASEREIEQTIFERLQQYTFVTNIRWWKLSDHNLK